MIWLMQFIILDYRCFSTYLWSFIILRNVSLIRLKLSSIVTNDGLYPGDPIIGFNLRLGIQILDYFIPFEFFVLLHQNDKLCEKIWIILDNIIFTKVLSDLYFGKYLLGNIRLCWLYFHEELWKYEKRNSLNSD